MGPLLRLSKFDLARGENGLVKDDCLFALAFSLIYRSNFVLVFSFFFQYSCTPTLGLHPYHSYKRHVRGLWRWFAPKWKCKYQYRIIVFVVLSLLLYDVVVASSVATRFAWQRMKEMEWLVGVVGESGWLVLWAKKEAQQTVNISMYIIAKKERELFIYTIT